jgi:hypothetical protein
MRYGSSCVFFRRTGFRFVEGALVDPVILPELSHRPARAWRRLADGGANRINS